VRNEENQLTFLRRECEKLAQERDTLAHQKREKQDALEFHQPINSQTAATLDLYKKAKAANGDLKARVHQLEREVAKYHNIR
jgi:cell division protein FtsB